MILNYKDWGKAENEEILEFRIKVVERDYGGLFFMGRLKVRFCLWVEEEFLGLRRLNLKRRFYFWDKVESEEEERKKVR